MKNKASLFFKQMLAVLVAVVEAKSLAVKAKTSAVKTRLVVFGLLRNRKILNGAITQKIHALASDHHHNNAAEDEDDDDDEGKAIVLYNAAEACDTPRHDYQSDSEDDGDRADDDRYPDLRHSLFDEEDDGLGDCTGSVIDLVRNGRQEESEFRLEDEIDHVADVFIRRFHKQMRMQKQESFKRYKEMLERSV